MSNANKVALYQIENDKIRIIQLLTTLSLMEKYMFDLVIIREKQAGVTIEQGKILRCPRNVKIYEP